MPDKRTRVAIKGAKKDLKELQNNLKKKKSYSSREVKDMNEQVTLLKETIALYQNM